VDALSTCMLLKSPPLPARCTAPGAELQGHTQSEICIHLKYKYTLRLSNTCSSILPVAWRVWFSPRYCFSLNVFSALAAFSTFCP
jgi:hypothetical protein